MKIFNLILAVMFVIFAFLQINDPDPLVWILIYGSLAVTCVLAAFNIYNRTALIALIVIFAGYSTVYFSGVSKWLSTSDKGALFSNVAKMEHLYIEEAREFLGLMICIGVLIMHLVRSKRVKTKA
jgi:lipoprotein signal peptidase